MTALEQRTPTPSPTALSIAVEDDTVRRLPQRRWTRAEYERLVEIGILGKDDHVELLDGVIVEMSPIGSRHATSVSLTAKALRPLEDAGYVLRVQMPIAVSERGEPEPDIALVHGQIRDFVDAHPRTAALVIEVADTSLQIDRALKAGGYAAALVPEYWVLGIRTRRVYLHRDPELAPDEIGGGRYRSIQVLTEADTIAPLCAPRHTLQVADLLP